MVQTCCSRCRGPLPVDPAGEPAASGMCDACFAYFERTRRGVPFGEYLDAFAKPVLVSDGDGNVLAANTAMAAITGRKPEDIAGLRFGGALACERSRLPGGCGKTVHCRDCTIRRMVTEVSRTRLARKRVPAYFRTAAGRNELCISVRPLDADALEVIIEDAPPPEQ